MQTFIDPDPGILSQLKEDLDPTRPVVMLNLLRFAEVANYADETDISGREAYARYGGEASVKVRQAGGEVLYAGAVVAPVIGPADELWDQILIVKYPSFNAFLQMIMDPAYQKITIHRSAALADSRLTATQPL